MKTKTEARLADLAKCALRFKRAADKLANSYESVLKHSAGSPAARHAVDKLMAASVNYDALAVHLEHTIADCVSKPIETKEKVGEQDAS